MLHKDSTVNLQIQPNFSWSESELTLFHPYHKKKKRNNNKKPPHLAFTRGNGPIWVEGFGKGSAMCLSLKSPLLYLKQDQVCSNLKSVNIVFVLA